MHIKKFLTCLFAVAVLLVPLSGVSFTGSAAEPVKFSVEDVSGKAGKTVVAELVIKGKNVAGFDGKLTYDKSALTLEKIEKTAALPSGLFPTNVTKGSFQYISNNGTGVNLDGVMIKFTFKATKDGTYSFKLENVGAYDGTIGAPGQLPVQVGSDPPIMPNSSAGSSSKRSTTPSSSSKRSTTPSGGDTPNNASTSNDGSSSGSSGSSGSTSDIPSDTTGVEEGSQDENLKNSSSQSSNLLPGLDNGLIYILIIAGIVLISIVMIVVVSRKRK